MKTESIKLLPHYRKALTKLSKINIHGINANATYLFNSDGGYFTVTVFNIENENGTFYFYNHKTIEYIESKLDAALAAIKTGNFTTIKEAAREQYL